MLLDIVTDITPLGSHIWALVEEKFKLWIIDNERLQSSVGCRQSKNREQLSAAKPKKKNSDRLVNRIKNVAESMVKILEALIPQSNQEEIEQLVSEDLAQAVLGTKTSIDELKDFIRRILK